MNRWWMILFLPCILYGNENFSAIDQETSGFWAAQDNQKAAEIYEKLKLGPLTDWQKARVDYNLGTIYLSQQLTEKGLSLLLGIDPVSLSLPNIGENLLHNQAIGYLQFSQKGDSLDKRLFYAEKASQLLGSADDVRPLIKELYLKKKEEWMKLHDSGKNISKVHLDYTLLLFSDQFTIADIKALQKEAVDLEKEIQENLQKGAEALKENQRLVARFYLLAGLSRLDLIEHSSLTTPDEILEEALNQSTRSLQLLFLYALIGEKELLPIIQTQHQEVMKIAQLFIPGVLEKQKKEFEKGPCQEVPWNQVIPLFDKGYQEAVVTESGLKEKVFNEQVVMGREEQTVKFWQQALEALHHPLGGIGDPKTANEDIKETFRLIQEMHVEDEPQSKKIKTEFHAW